MVAQNDITYKKTTHNYKVTFLRTTKVTNIVAEDIPKYYFDFSEFPMILSETRTDLIVGKDSVVTKCFQFWYDIIYAFKFFQYILECLN